MLTNHGHMTSSLNHLTIYRKFGNLWSEILNYRMKWFSWNFILSKFHKEIMSQALYLPVNNGESRKPWRISQYGAHEPAPTQSFEVLQKYCRMMVYTVPCMIVLNTRCSKLNSWYWCGTSLLVYTLQSPSWPPVNSV